MSDDLIAIYRGLSREQGLLRLVTDAFEPLSLQAEGELSTEEYEHWRDRWLREAELVLQHARNGPNSAHLDESDG